MIYYNDDDHDDLEMFQSAAEKLGLNAKVFQNTDDMMAALESDAAPNMIFLDLNMHRKHGFEVLAELRESEKGAKVPILIYSTTKSQESIDKAFHLGANYYVCKSNTFGGIMDSIKYSTSIDWNAVTPERSGFVYTSSTLSNEL